MISDFIALLLTMTKQKVGFCFVTAYSIKLKISKPSFLKILVNGVWDIYIF